MRASILRQELITAFEKGYKAAKTNPASGEPIEMMITEQHKMGKMAVDYAHFIIAKVTPDDANI